jgi:hypothetical protein
MTCGIRLQNKLLNAEEALVVLTEQAGELSHLLARTSQTLLHRPSLLKLTAEEIKGIARVQRLANKIASLEQRRQELQRKVGSFSR